VTALQSLSPGQPGAIMVADVGDAQFSPDPLAIGLQEWAVVCSALLAGRLMVSVRKGGIHERQGGLFTPEYSRFALVPTHLHQRADRLQPTYAALMAGDPPAPGTIPVSGWCTVERVWKATDLVRIRALGSELAWTAAELASRFAYRDQPFLYVLALRAWRLPAIQTIIDHPSYAGCRSWIPLHESIPTNLSTPAIGEADFAMRLHQITAILERP